VATYRTTAKGIYNKHRRQLQTAIEDLQWCNRRGEEGRIVPPWQAKVLFFFCLIFFSFIILLLFPFFGVFPVI